MPYFNKDIVPRLEDGYLRPRPSADYSEVCLFSVRELDRCKMGLIQAMSDISMLGIQLQRTQRDIAILQMRAEAAERCVGTAEDLIQMRTAELEVAIKHINKLESTNSALMKRINADKRNFPTINKLPPPDRNTLDTTVYPDIASIKTNIKEKDQEEDNQPSITQPSTPPASAPLVAQPSTDDIEDTDIVTTTPDSTTSNNGNMEGFFSTLAGFLGWGANEDDNRGQTKSNVHHYDDPLIGCDDLFVCSSVLMGGTNHSTSEDDNQSKWPFW